MTSKEFKRKLDYYRNFLSAVDIFKDGWSWCYKATLIDCFNVVHTYYVLHPDTSCFGDSIKRDCHSIWFERYSMQEYSIEVKYLTVFLKHCTEYQLEVIRQDSQLKSFLTLLAFEQ